MIPKDHPPAQPGGFAGRFLWWFAATAILAAGLVLGAAALVAAGIILTVLWIYVLVRGAMQLRKAQKHLGEGPTVVEGEYVVVERGEKQRSTSRGDD